MDAAEQAFAAQVQDERTKTAHMWLNKLASCGLPKSSIGVEVKLSIEYDDGASMEIEYRIEPK